MAAFNYLIPQTTSYTCALPLEDCLEILQSKSGQLLYPESGGLLGRRIWIKIIFNSIGNYKYTLSVPVGRGSPIRLNGYLRQIDEYHTEAIIEDESLLKQLVVELIIVMFLIMTGGLISHLNAFATLLVFSLIALLLGFSLVRRGTTNQKLREFLANTLSASTP